MKKLSAVLLVVCLMFSLCACDFLKDVADLAANPIPQTKTFDLDGVSITLNTNFTRMDFIDEEYDFIVGDPTVSILGTKVEYDAAVAGDLTVRDYAESYQSLLEVEEKTEISEIDGIPTMNCVFTGDDGDTDAAIMFYKTDKCFWVITFAAASDKFDGVYDDICTYAKSVKFE